MPRRSAFKHKTIALPICKNAGAGGYIGSKVQKLCHNRARTGIAQGFRLCGSRMIGSNGVGIPCGDSISDKN